MNTVFCIMLALQVSQPAVRTPHFTGTYRSHQASVESNREGASDTVMVVDCYKQNHRLFFAHGDVFCQDQTGKGWDQAARLNEVGSRPQTATVECWQDSIAVEMTADESTDKVVYRTSKVIGRLWGHLLVISPIHGK